MNIIQDIISEQLMFALGWTVVHSVWQGMLVALLAAVVMLGLPGKSARLRYTVYNIALFTIFLLAIFTFANLYESGKQIVGETSLSSPDIIVQIASTESWWEHYSQQFIQYFNTHLPLIVSIWLIGLGFFLLRLLGGLAYLQRLKRVQTYPLSKVWQDRLAKMLETLNYKGSIQLVESALVRVPMMMGYFKPIILLPVGTINALSQEEVEAILAHEVGHILRNDYLLNILQSIIEALFYFNPAVWWVSANIRMERENCCDDIAVELCGDSLAYAKALVRLQELHQAAPNFAMAFSGRKHQLLNRVKRILNQPQNKSNIMEKFTATCLLLCAILLFSLSAHSSPQPSPEPQLAYNAPQPNPDPDPKVKPAKLVKPKVKPKPKLKPLTAIVKDTLPAGKIRIEIDEKDKKVEAKIEDRKIKFLKIDGKEIPPVEYDKHQEFVEQLFEDLPEAPPAPPAPPTPLAPSAKVAPVAPVAPKAKAAPVAPTAPVAPAAPEWNSKKIKKITREQDDNGQTVIIIESDNGADSIQIAIDDDIIYLDGETIDIGETAIIVEDQAWPFINLSEGNFDLKGWSGTHPQLAWPQNELVLPDNVQAIQKMKEAQQLQEEIWKEYLEGYKKGLNKNELGLEDYNKAFKLYQEEFNQENQNFNDVFRVYKGKLKGLEKLHVIPNKMNFSGLAMIAPFADNEFSPLTFSAGTLMEQELLRDGLIKKASKYKLEFTDKGLKINGKRQPVHIYRKYKGLYENQNGLKLYGKNKITIEKN